LKVKHLKTGRFYEIVAERVLYLDTDLFMVVYKRTDETDGKVRHWCRTSIEFWQKFEKVKKEV